MSFLIFDWMWHLSFSVPSYTTVWRPVHDHSASTLSGTASLDSKKPEDVTVSRVLITLFMMYHTFELCVNYESTSNQISFLNMILVFFPYNIILIWVNRV